MLPKKKIKTLIICFVGGMQAVGVDNTFRRKFDREEYLQRAREREEKVLGFRNHYCFQNVNLIMWLIVSNYFEFLGGTFITGKGWTVEI